MAKPSPTFFKDEGFEQNKMLEVHHCLTNDSFLVFGVVRARSATLAVAFVAVGMGTNERGRSQFYWFHTPVQKKLESI